MDFIDEEDGTAPRRLPPKFRGRDDLFHFLDPRGDGADRNELGARRGREQPAHGGLARAGRAPEDQRVQRLLIDRLAERTARPQ